MQRWHQHGPVELAWGLARLDCPFAGTSGSCLLLDEARIELQRRGLTQRRLDLRSIHTERVSLLLGSGWVLACALVEAVVVIVVLIVAATLVQAAASTDEVRSRSTTILRVWS